MMEKNTRMVTAAFALLGGVAALTTAVAILRARNNSPKVRSNKVLSVCETAISELEKRINDHAVIHLSRSA